MALISIADVVSLCKGKRVLVRGNINVPIANGAVVDAYRIEMMMPTITLLREAGAQVILCGHIGRDATATIAPIARYLQEQLPTVVIRDILAPDIQQTIAQIAPKTVILLENLRQHPEEEANDEAFAKHLASLADIFVQDDFSVCHRKHASVVGVPNYIPSYAGLQVMQEIEHLQKAFTPEHPFLFILGGAKVETKLPLLQQFKDKADQVFVGGVLANDFFKAMGKEVGVSTVSTTPVPEDMLQQANIMLPQDVVVLRNTKHETVSLDEVLPKDAIMDAGKQSIKTLIDTIKRAKCILWNGPIGYCEGGFEDATVAIAKAIADSHAYSIIGGGDTIAALPEGVEQAFTFVSTGGGAMLDYLAHQSLPGIDALDTKH